MSTIFDKTVLHIRRKTLAVVAMLLLIVAPTSITAFVESAFALSADTASNRFEQPVNPDGNCTNLAYTTESSLKLKAEPLTSAAKDEYQSGTIPILRLTFSESVDPETGNTISGEEKIELMNKSDDHSYRAEGVTLDLEVPPAYDNPEDDLWDGVSGYGGETNLSLEFIRGRGNSTWREPKKPYKFKLDKGANLFGMGENKHWVLLANYYDTSLTIDRLVGWLGDQMGFSFTPRGVPVDLYMNDA